VQLAQGLRRLTLWRRDDVLAHHEDLIKRRITVDKVHGARWFPDQRIRVPRRRRDGLQAAGVGLAMAIAMLCWNPNRRQHHFPREVRRRPCHAASTPM
jgi:hypothetical protein